jgi:hypothetical protein
MKKVPQKYYYGYGDREVEIELEFTDKKYKRRLCLLTDGDQYYVTEKLALRKIEDTQHYRTKKRLEKELEDLRTRKEKIKEEIEKEAIEGLAFRMKFNSLFMDNGKYTSAGVIIANELGKLIKEKVGEK